MGDRKKTLFIKEDLRNLTKFLVCTKDKCSNQKEKPVCGTDGITYSNQCFLDFASCKSNGEITKKTKGKCPCKIS